MLDFGFMNGGMLLKIPGLTTLFCPAFNQRQSDVQEGWKVILLA